jgi:hypothetical protein
MAPCRSCVNRHLGGTSIYIRTTWCYILEEGILHSHRRENLKSNFFTIISILTVTTDSWLTEGWWPGLEIIYKLCLENWLGCQISRDKLHVKLLRTEWMEFHFTFEHALGNCRTFSWLGLLLVFNVLKNYRSFSETALIFLPIAFE